MRAHRVTRRTVRAGCPTCHGRAVLWSGGQAQGNAAKHTDATGHRTWVRVEMDLEYLPRRVRPRGTRGR